MKKKKRQTVLKNLSNEPEDLVLAEERTTEADRELIMDGEILIVNDDNNDDIMIIVDHGRWDCNR